MLRQEIITAMDAGEIGMVQAMEEFENLHKHYRQTETEQEIPVDELKTDEPSEQQMELNF
jgi:hypothetical protein